ncbi:hypothetical protein ACROYT_G031041 [Oculina patagonica]
MKMPMTVTCVIHTGIWCYRVCHTTLLWVSIFRQSKGKMSLTQEMQSTSLEGAERPKPSKYEKEAESKSFQQSSPHPNSKGKRSLPEIHDCGL